MVVIAHAEAASKLEMATDAQLLKLYGLLRSALLSRHWLTMRYWPSYYVSDFNHLGTQKKGADASIHNLDPPKAGSDDVDSVDKLLGLDPSGDGLHARWTVGNHEHENPLIETGSALGCLAVEHHLGSTEALPAIERTFGTLEKLFKFKDRGDHFAGYVIRWDAVASDNWVLHDNDEPKQCRDFLTTPDGRYLYSAPLTSALLAAAEAPPADELAFRRHELSKDELIGILPGYRLVHMLVDKPGVKSSVEQQVARIGDYLAQFNYVLVRPDGGFSARGATGFLSGLVPPLRAAIRSITGQDASPRGSFEDSLEAGGVLVKLKDQLRAYGIAGAAAGTLFPFGTLLLSALPVNPLTGWHFARALCLYVNKDVFQVKKAERGEFAAGYLLSKLPDWLSFGAVMTLLALPGASGKDFPRRWTLATLDAEGLDKDAIGAAYMAWLLARDSLPGPLADRPANLPIEPSPNRPDVAKPSGGPGEGAANAVSWAVAMLFGLPGAERRVAQSLQTLHDEITASKRWSSDLTLEQPSARQNAQAPNELLEHVGIALEYMLALALTWLHQKRRADAGRGLSSTLPAPPNLASNPLPPVSVPLSIANDSAAPIPADVGAAAVAAEGELGTGSVLGGGIAPERPDDVTAPTSPVSEVVVEAFADDSLLHTNTSTAPVEIKAPSARPDGAVANVQCAGHDPDTVFRSIDFEHVLEPPPGKSFVMIGPMPLPVEGPDSRVIHVSVTSGAPDTYKGRYRATWQYSWTYSAAP